METISLYELLIKLNITDLRTARKWCVRNDIVIMKHGKIEFISEVDFKRAFERPFIEKLKSKFGHDWKSVYELYDSGNIPALEALNETKNVAYRAYKPKNKIISGYLNKYESNDNTKAA
jgi:hypothetical protein